MPTEIFLPELSVRSTNKDSNKFSMKMDLVLHCLKEIPFRIKIPTPPPRPLERVEKTRGWKPGSGKRSAL